MYYDNIWRINFICIHFKGGSSLYNYRVSALGTKNNFHHFSRFYNHGSTLVRKKFSSKKAYTINSLMILFESFRQK